MRAIIILFIIAICAGCKQRQMVEDKLVVVDTTYNTDEKNPLIFVCAYNGDTIVQQVPRGYLYIQRKGDIPIKDFLVADSVELTLVAKGFHECNSHCIYYDSITTINNPKLQKLAGEYIATVFADEDIFRSNVSDDKTQGGKGIQRIAKGKIIHAQVQNDRFNHVGLVFIENNAQWPVN